VSKVIALTLLTKPGCHLCDEARTVLNQALIEFAELNSSASEITVTELNILEDPELLEKFAEEIPVLQINGETHAYWRIDEDRLLKALEQLT
jgi:glutaredoxin